MSWEPIEVSLATIEDGLSDLSEDSLPSVLKALDRFQQEPLVLIHRGVLTKYVSLICDDFFQLTKDDIKLWRCKVFYTIAKVVSWKRCIQYLPTDIYLLKKLIPLLENDEKEASWYIQFLILSWIYILCLSPFQLDIDEKIYRMVSKFNAPSVAPLVVNIRSQLLSKNKLLFAKYRYELDLSTFNGILKLVIPHYRNGDADDYSVLDVQTLDKFTKVCLGESLELIKLKILPKLFLVYALEMDVDRTQDIVAWLVNRFSDDFTNNRFAIAHCYAKIVRIVIEELEEDEMFELLVENCLVPTTTMLRLEPWDVLDRNRLHTYLLVIAELSTSIVAHSSKNAVAVISQDIIPYASRFQQLRASTIQGSQLRDASNFICWSLARAKIGKNLVSEKDLNSVFLNVLMCSLYDRELLIRKSANAALQEILGRYVTFAGILDNRTILQIIELPINNLPRNIISNTVTLYEMLYRNNKDFAKFMIHWLFEACILGNYDLNLVEWATEALCRWSNDRLNGPQEVGLPCRIEDLNISTPLEASRLLFFLVRMQLHGSSLAAGRMHIISEYVMENTKDLQVRKNDYELFRFLSIFEYIALMLKDDQSGFRLNTVSIDLIIRMLKGFTPSMSFHGNIVCLLRTILSLISYTSTKFASYETEIKFWNQFENMIRFNNPSCCCAFSAVEPQRLVRMFRINLSLMDCQGKCQTLDSFNTQGSFQKVVQQDRDILNPVAKLLNDYTITEQGDVGRLVRTSAARLILNNMDLFFVDEKLSSRIIASLVRLSGEPNEDIRAVSVRILQRKVGVAENKINLLQLLELQIFQFNEYLKEFWKGFLMSAGAIHSTEIQIRTAVDSFLYYYSFIVANDVKRLELCNDLVRIIPSSKTITENKLKSNLDHETGIANQDILKIAVSYINFWHRIIESGLRINPNFNFEGFYAKLFNLHLLNGASLLRTTVVGFFAQLAVSFVHSRGLSDKKLVNSIIERLFTIVRREASQRRKATQTSLEQECLKSLAMIFLEFKLHIKLRNLVECSNNKDKLLGASTSLFMIG